MAKRVGSRVDSNRRGTGVRRLGGGTPDGAEDQPAVVFEYFAGMIFLRLIDAGDSCGVGPRIYGPGGGNGDWLRGCGFEGSSENTSFAVGVFICFQ